MEKTLAYLSTDEFEELIEHVIDDRLNLWLTQILDALPGSQEEEKATLQPEFAESLRRSIEQARSGEGTEIKAFRAHLGR